MRLTEAESSWTRDLSSALGRPVRVRFGRARRNLIVARPDNPQGDWNGALLVRLNHVAADAPAEVRADLAAWLKNGGRARAASARIDAWIAEMTAQLNQLPPPLPRLAPKGEAHDLTPLAEDLLRAEFSDRTPRLAELPHLTWGRRAPSRARHTLQLGSYDSTRKLVRIHPVLDQPAVPTAFVRYVVFHELLHAAFDDPDREKRNDSGARHHSPAFLAREAQYPDYGAAQAWQTQNIRRLIRSARDGRPLRSFKRSLFNFLGTTQ